jgi:hypothetical protein
MAEHALLPYQRTLNRAPKLARRLLERGLPGAFGYFNARTQYFDEVLLQETRAGLQQVVILGAGFDSRSLRFGPVPNLVEIGRWQNQPAERLTTLPPHATFNHSLAMKDGSCLWPSIFRS